jgi:hypothetical protein
MIRRGLVEVLCWSPLLALLVAGMRREPAVAAFGVATLALVAFCVGAAAADRRRR